MSMFMCIHLLDWPADQQSADPHVQSLKHPRGICSSAIPVVINFKELGKWNLSFKQPVYSHSEAQLLQTDKSGEKCSWHWNKFLLTESRTFFPFALLWSRQLQLTTASYIKPIMSDWRLLVTDMKSCRVATLIRLPSLATTEDGISKHFFGSCLPVCAEHSSEYRFLCASCWDPRGCVCALALHGGLDAMKLKPWLWVTVNTPLRAH